MSDTPAWVPEEYELIHLLGSGQTSNVYLARHAVMGNVALKLPRPGLQEKPVLRRMFENEVQITLSMRHKHLVAGLAGSPTGAWAFLALEYCAGGTLDQLLLERGQLPLERACDLISGVAAGLQQSHAQQVLHRDVKPANVFLTEWGAAKLGDFGTGSFMTEDNSERVGTAFYMAPEVFEGAAASVASDVYSLGILAYEVLAGQRPFLGDTFDQLMLAHRTGLPKPLDFHRPRIDRHLVSVVSRAMSRERSRRYETVEQFHRAFDDASGITARQKADSMATGRAGRAIPSAGEQGKDGGGNGARRGPFAWFRRRSND